MKLALLLAAASAIAPSLEWPTARGNNARTGNPDGKPGPVTAQLLWAEKSAAHYVAAPVTDGRRLYVSALGPFQTPLFQAFTVEPGPQLRWRKQTPLLRSPVVCAPAVAGGCVVFGDGMHQSDGGNLYCLGAEDGALIWRLGVAGKLVHLEGGPAIAQGRVYVGAGQAGLLCVALDRVSLAGREQSRAEIVAGRQQRWAELLARYEDQKQKDPDFAVPPTENDLPAPVPVMHWQRGQNQWHIDSPVAVAGDRVLAGSAFLEDEKIGERAVVCVAANDGAVLWKTPLPFNPWAGPALSGTTVVVAGSSIRFDPKQLAGARGEVVALDLADGTVRWRKPVRGGIVSPVALAGGCAVATATDGKVRAWDLATGEPRWQYDGGNPFFAGPAVAGELVYVADLSGNVFALALADGTVRWRLALGPALPGMVYGSPLLHHGRLYLATCNLESNNPNPTNALFCIGEK